MTEYQKIENELIPLGWLPEQGDGDHIKFRKKGTPDFITVSRSIKATARALNNMYADIRRKEPGFTLGRPIKAKQNEPEEEKEERIPDSIPEWMHPTRQVRYITPENGDFSKLTDPHAVMNINYTVLGVNDQGTEDRLGPEEVTVMIRDTEGLHEPFLVTPDDLASWDLVKCSECERILPESHMPHKDGRPVCPECAERKRQEAIQKEQEEQEKEKKNVLKGSSATEQLKDFKENISDIVDKYKDVRISSLPEEKRKEIEDDLAKTYAKLPSKLKNMLLKSMPEMGAFLGVKDKMTPFAAWQQFLSKSYEETTLLFLAHESDKDKNNYRKSLYTTSFGTRKLRNKESMKSFTIIDIIARNKLMALHVWMNQDRVFENFSNAFEKDELLAIRLQHPGSKTYQYLVNAYTGQGKEDLQHLKDFLSEEEINKALERTRRDLQMPSGQEAMKAILEWAYKASGKSRGDDTLAHKVMKVNVLRAVRDKDQEDFEHAPAYYKARIVYNDVDYGEEGYDKLRNALEENPDPFGFPAVIRIEKSTDMEFNGTEYNNFTEDFGKTYDEVEEKPGEAHEYGFHCGDYLFSIVKDDEGVWTKYNNEDEKKYGGAYFEEIVRAFQAIAMDEEGFISRAMHEGLKRLLQDKAYSGLLKKLIIQEFNFEGPDDGNFLFKILNCKDKELFDVVTPELKTEKEKENFVKKVKDTIFTLLTLTKETPLSQGIKDAIKRYNKKNEEIKKESTMNENNFLDQKNPGSANPAAGELTTRELLKELKSRGVSFDNLEITIRKSIDFNDI